jgi:hypothetical protein
MIPWHVHHHGGVLQTINMNYEKLLHNVSWSSTSSINGKIDVQSHLQGSMVMKMVDFIMIRHVVPMFS